VTDTELELPQGWVKQAFDLCISNIIGGDWGSPVKEEIDNDFVKVQVLRSTELKNWKMEKGSTAESRIIKKSSLEKRQLHNGDIILEVSGGGTKFPVGRSVLITTSITDNFSVPIICSNFFRKITLSQFLDPMYASNFLDYYYGSGETIKFKNQSVNIQNLKTKEYLSTLSIPIPPLNEQKRIVSKIEELFSRIDSVKQSMENTKLQLEQYRFSLLKSVFEGKRLVKTGEVCDGIVPGRYKPQKFDGDIPWITTPDLDGLYISKSKKNLCVSKEEVKKVRMKIMPKQTVLLTCVGDLGRICITKNEVVPNQQFHGFVCTEKILPKYLAYALTIQIRQMFSASTSTTISYMNKTICNNLKIPLASSIEEQEQIVSQIEQGFSLIENTTQIVESSLQNLQTMKMSILKQAFEGKLVPQDPNDEPASVLLERIKLKN